MERQEFFNHPAEWETRITSLPLRCQTERHGYFLTSDEHR